MIKLMTQRSGALRPNADVGSPACCNIEQSKISVQRTRHAQQTGLGSGTVSHCCAHNSGESVGGCACPARCDVCCRLPCAHNSGVTTAVTKCMPHQYMLRSPPQCHYACHLQVCDKRNFAVTEDRPVVHEHTRHILKHHPAEKQFVKQTK